MSSVAWHLPWKAHTVSHGVLDILRGCNIRCRDCYNALPPTLKPLERIQSELAILKQRRQLGMVSIAGGETLLHPDLEAIIRMIKREGWVAQLFTNGVLLTDARLEKLKAAGLDIIFVHLEAGQARPDLRKDADRSELARVRNDCAARIARHGIDVGLSITAYDDRLDEVLDVVSDTLQSPDVNYLLVTLHRDSTNFAQVEGNLEAGLRGRLKEPALQRTDRLTNQQIMALLEGKLNLRPFGYLGSNHDRHDPRWLSYLVATRRSGDRLVARHALRASLFERIYLALMLRLRGHYPMYRPQLRRELIGQLVFNSLLGGRAFHNFNFLLQGLLGRQAFSMKRLLFQAPAEIDANGRLTHCLHCPDAVVIGDQLVPVCIADRHRHASPVVGPSA